jgi:hypothetical protein
MYDHASDQLKRDLNDEATQEHVFQLTGPESSAGQWLKLELG